VGRAHGHDSARQHDGAGGGKGQESVQAEAGDQGSILRIAASKVPGIRTRKICLTGSGRSREFWFPAFKAMTGSGFHATISAAGQANCHVFRLLAGPGGHN
jgi:hypothetical protein